MKSVIERDVLQDAIESLIQDGYPVKTDESLAGWDEFIHENFNVSDEEIQAVRIECESILVEIMRGQQ